jgi:hypothetical protein
MVIKQTEMEYILEPMEGFYHQRDSYEFEIEECLSSWRGNMEYRVLDKLKSIYRVFCGEFSDNELVSEKLTLDWMNNRQLELGQR